MRRIKPYRPAGACPLEHFSDDPQIALHKLAQAEDYELNGMLAECVARWLDIPDHQRQNCDISWREGRRYGIIKPPETGEQTIQNPNGNGPKPTNEILSRFRSTPVSHEILFAFDAQTGKQLYSSGDMLKNWTHFSEPVVALGKVFLVSHDGHLFAFGLPR